MKFLRKDRNSLSYVDKLYTYLTMILHIKDIFYFLGYTKDQNPFFLSLAADDIDHVVSLIDDIFRRGGRGVWQSKHGTVIHFSLRDRQWQVGLISSQCEDFGQRKKQSYN